MNALPITEIQARIHIRRLKKTYIGSEFKVIGSGVCCYVREIRQRPIKAVGVTTADMTIMHGRAVGQRKPIRPSLPMPRMVA